MKKQYQSLVIILILILTNTSVFSAGMELTHNVNPANFPKRLKENAKFHPLAKGYIDITKPPYAAFGDGKNDDTNAIQNAMDDAYSSNLVVFFPANKIYLVSKQLKCISTKRGSRKFAYQLTGSIIGKAPVIRLKDGSFVDNNILILFELQTDGKPNPPSLYGSTFRGINIDMGNNPTINAISMAGAQYCVIEDVKIYGSQFNAGICSLPGSGGGIVNLTIIGGKIGIDQNQYRPNPTINGLTLENQSQYGIRITESRGPVIVTGFKIVSPKNPSEHYRAVYVKNTRSFEANGRIDHGNSNLCLTDGTIEVSGSSGKAIYNFAQDVTMNNVFVKASEVIESGIVNTPSKIVVGNPNQWSRISSYIFSSQLDKSSVFMNDKECNDRTTHFQLFDPLVSQEPKADFLAQHGWGKLPNWRDSNLIDIVKDFGATPENENEKDDDGKAIQKAIDQSTTIGHPNYGKTVFIPRGHFHITEPLLFKSGLKIIGAGKFISVIQAANEWKNSLGPIIQSENSAEGSLLMRDLAILGFTNMSYLNIRTNNALICDVVTEKVRLPYSKTFEPLNKPEVPYINFTDSAGGKVFFICTDHIATGENKADSGREKNYHLVAIQNTIHPLTFYQLSVEHMRNSPQTLIDNAKHVTIFGYKYELVRELLNIINSDDIKIIGGSGNYQLEDPNDRAIIVIENSKNILIQNLNRKSNEEAFGHPVSDICKYWIVNGEDKISGDYGILQYKNN
jgi:hypothetical protein